MRLSAAQTLQKTLWCEWLGDIAFQGTGILTSCWRHDRIKDLGFNPAPEKNGSFPRTGI